MDGSEALRLAAVPPAGDTEYDRCEECAAPVDGEQRYCVVCGAHRRGAADPAAEYLRRAAARTPRGGVVMAGPLAGHARSRRSGAPLGAAVALAVVPLAVAVGVLVARPGSNEDARLLAALRDQRPQVVNVGSGASTAAASSLAAAAATTHRTGRKRTSATRAGRLIVSTSSLSGAKPTRAEVQQGANVVAKVQKAAGKSYVNSQQGLPSSVVVP